MQKVGFAVAVVTLFFAFGACSSFGGTDQTGAANDSGSDGPNPVTGNPSELSFEITPVNPVVTVQQGLSAKLAVQVIRSKDLDESIQLSLTDLPDGVTATSVPLSGDAGEIEVTATAAAMQGTFKATLSGQAMGGGASPIMSITSISILVRGKPGDVDTTFGGGIVSSMFGTNAGAVTLAQLLGSADDKTYLVANCSAVNNYTCVARVDEHGIPDATYGSNGVAVLPMLSAHDAILNPDGTLIVAGGSGGSSIGRLDASGLPDKNFGPQTAGAGVIEFDGQGAFAVTQRADGEIFVGWDYHDPGTGLTKAASSRFAPNGVMRSNYGTAGTAIAGFGQVASIATKTDPTDLAFGHVILVWVNELTNAPQGLNLLVATDVGGVDTSFGSTPKNVFIEGGAARYIALAPGIAQLPDHSLITVFAGEVGWCLYKFAPSYTGDQNFGTAGLVGPIANYHNSSDVDADGMGRILVPFDVAPGAARFTSTGSLDTSFGAGGYVSPSVGAQSRSLKMLVQKSGRIIDAVQQTQPTTDVTLVAYWP